MICWLVFSGLCPVAWLKLHCVTVLYPSLTRVSLGEMVYNLSRAGKLSPVDAVVGDDPTALVNPDRQGLEYLPKPGK